VAHSLRSRTRLLVCCSLAMPALVGLGGHTVANATVKTPGALGAAPASSWQSNATVWKMADSRTTGDVYMVGDFTALRPPGVAAGTAADVPTNYFGALDAATGAPDPGFDATHTFTQPGTLPLTNGTVAVSPDGNTVYVGGAFTQVDNVNHFHIAAFDATTGALLPWSPQVGISTSKVTAIATAGSVVYIGGSFTKVNGTTTGADLAALDATSTSGAVLPWGTAPGPSTNDAVDALAVTPDDSQVVAGGFFEQVDGAPQSADGKTRYNKAVIIGGLGSSTPGVIEPMSADSVVVPPNSSRCVSNVKDIDISGGVAYLADEGTGGSCFDGTWATKLSDGSLIWVNRCLGATQAVQVIGDYLYKGSHAHDCRTNNTNGPVSNDPANFPSLPDKQARHLLSENLSNGFLGPFYPDVNAGPNLGPRTMTTDGTQLYVGGDFTSANHVNQQGILRFTPTNNFHTPTPADPLVSSTRTGVVKITETAPVDLDDPSLTLELFRNGAKTPVATANVTSYFWKPAVVHWVERRQRPISHYTFQVRALERFGSSRSSLSAVRPVTVACGLPHKPQRAIARVKISRPRKGIRRVSINACSRTRVKMTFEVRQGRRHVLAKKIQNGVFAGDRTAKLRIKKSRGTVRAYVIFRHGSHHAVMARRVRLPR
jgi:hypothetical protein